MSPSCASTLAGSAPSAGSLITTAARPSLSRSRSSSQMNASSQTEAMPPLVLLAGGLASRLGSLTAHLPKSLLPVAGQPFIAHQLRLLATQNIREVVICCGHLGEQIQRFVGDGSRF